VISGLDQIWSGEGPYYLGVSVYRSLCNMNYSLTRYEKLEMDDQMVRNESMDARTEQCVKPALSMILLM